MSHFPARLGQIPIELALNIGNEIVRLADTHAPEAGVRFRARCRIPSKSALMERAVLMVQVARLKSVPLRSSG